MTDLKFSLEELADADAPPSTIDIDKARHDGRRKMVTARLAPVGTGVAVIAACGIAVSGIAGGGSSSTGAASGSNSQTQTQAPAKAAAFTGTDPLSTHAAFGKLPAGWMLGTIEDGPDYGNKVSAMNGTDLKTAAFVSLQVTAKEPAANEFPDQKTEPAAVAGSTKAYYIDVPPMVKDTKPLYLLRWQTAAGAWVTLGGSNMASKEAARATLDELAAGVTVGDTAVPLPVHIEGLPKNLPAHSQELNVPALGTGKPWDVELLFGTSAHLVVVSVTPSGPDTPKSEPSHSVLPPRDPNAPKPDIASKDENGLTVTVIAAPGDLDSIGGAKGLLANITSLGTDQAKWTTHVVG